MEQFKNKSERRCVYILVFGEAFKFSGLNYSAYFRRLVSSTLFWIFFVALLFCVSGKALPQALRVSQTQFITGNQPGTGIKSLIPTSDNGLLFIGYAVSKPGGGLPSLAIDTINTNVLVGKIDSNNNISWIKVYGGSDDDIAVSACETPGGNYMVLAVTSSANGDISFNHGTNDFWLLKIDGNGTLLWEKTFGSTRSDDPTKVIATKDGGFMMCGLTNGLDGDVPAHFGGYFSMDWLVIKIDSTGLVEWSKNIGGTGNEEDCSILEFGNNYYLIGSSNSIDSNCYDTSWHSGVYTSDNYHVLKLSNIGGVVWDKSFGGSDDDEVADAIFDANDKSIVVNGTTNSNDYFVTGHHDCLDKGDMWVVKVDTNGALVWQRALGSIQAETGTGICLRHEGGYMVYGSTAHQYCNEPTYSNIGAFDCLLFAIGADGNETTHTIFGGLDVELPYTIVQLKAQYAACGISMSNVFTEGITVGRNADGQEGYITYLEYWPLATHNITYPELRVTISPSPAISQAIIRSNEPISGIQIKSISGQIIKELIPSSSSFSLTVNLQEWQPGTYIVDVRTINGNVSRERLIKL